MLRSITKIPISSSFATIKLPSTAVGPYLAGKHLARLRVKAGYLKGPGQIGLFGAPGAPHSLITPSLELSCQPREWNQGASRVASCGPLPLGRSRGRTRQSNDRKLERNRGGADAQAFPSFHQSASPDSRVDLNWLAHRKGQAGAANTIRVLLPRLMAPVDAESMVSLLAECNFYWGSGSTVPSVQSGL